jgi:SAM-dependent methyltransferase
MRSLPAVLAILREAAARLAIDYGRNDTEHRLGYSLGYLASMLEVVPRLAGRRVLEVGCSDGLVSALVAELGAREVVGVDADPGIGRSFRSPRIAYCRCDAHRLPLADDSFDLVISIATFEHLRSRARCSIRSLGFYRPEELRTSRLGRSTSRPSAITCSVG